MIIAKPITKILGFLAGLSAMATLVLLLLWYIGNSVSFLPDAALQNIAHWRDYFTIGTLLLAGLQFALNRNIIFAIILVAIIAGVLAFMIYSNNTVDTQATVSMFNLAAC